MNILTYCLFLALCLAEPSGVVSTLSGGFNGLSDVAIMLSGDVVVADTNDNNIRKLSSSGESRHSLQSKVLSLKKLSD